MKWINFTIFFWIFSIFWKKIYNFYRNILRKFREIDLFDFTIFFWPGLFKIFWPSVVRMWDIDVVLLTILEWQAVYFHLEDFYQFESEKMTWSWWRSLSNKLWPLVLWIRMWEIYLHGCSLVICQRILERVEAWFTAKGNYHQLLKWTFWNPNSMCFRYLEHCLS